MNEFEKHLRDQRDAPLPGLTPPAGANERFGWEAPAPRRRRNGYWLGLLLLVGTCGTCLWLDEPASLPNGRTMALETLEKLPAETSDDPIVPAPLTEAVSRRRSGQQSVSTPTFVGTRSTIRTARTPVEPISDVHPSPAAASTRLGETSILPMTIPPESTAPTNATVSRSPASAAAPTTDASLPVPHSPGTIAVKSTSTTATSTAMSLPVEPAEFRSSRAPFRAQQRTSRWQWSLRWSTTFRQPEWTNVVNTYRRLDSPSAEEGFTSFLPDGTPLYLEPLEEERIPDRRLLWTHRFNVGLQHHRNWRFGLEVGRMRNFRSPYPEVTPTEGVVHRLAEYQSTLWWSGVSVGYRREWRRFGARVDATLLGPTLNTSRERERQVLPGHAYQTNENRQTRWDFRLEPMIDLNFYFRVTPQLSVGPTFNVLVYGRTEFRRFNQDDIFRNFWLTRLPAGQLTAQYDF